MGRSDCTMYMNDVPKLPLGAFENHKSLINKAIHWLRTRSNCLSVIRSDLLKTTESGTCNGEDTGSKKEEEEEPKDANDEEEGVKASEAG
ncbi:hypothetical protein NDU88_008143 [Pleurodeles waltl]|uniref:Uncharacterized protein n=1 Tax=Pleurodeles waltl TaxID=8319 RepID=A0AAV7N669_PLEWA|nr:hypothetical protein NDU88_008143 [Pleurodeles waltl]